MGLTEPKNLTSIEFTFVYRYQTIIRIIFLSATGGRSLAYRSERHAGGAGGLRPLSEKKENIAGCNQGTKIPFSRIKSYLYPAPKSLFIVTSPFMVITVPSGTKVFDVITRSKSSLLPSFK